MHADLLEASVLSGGSGGQVRRSRNGSILFSGSDEAMGRFGSFAVLYTSGADYLLLAQGRITATVASPAGHLVMRPIDGHLLVQAISPDLWEVTIELDCADRGPSDALKNLPPDSESTSAGSVVVQVMSTLGHGHATKEMPRVETATGPDQRPTKTHTRFEGEDSIGKVVANLDAWPATAPLREQRTTDVMVWGDTCPKGHVNNPSATFCGSCGRKMGISGTRESVLRRRPSLGALVVTDGDSYSLFRDLIIGSEPSLDEDVVSGAATPVELADETEVVSRQHARIVLDGWSVLIRDLQSTNGTWICRDSEADSWEAVHPGETIRLQSGNQIRIASHILEVFLHHVRSAADRP